MRVAIIKTGDIFSRSDSLWKLELVLHLYSFLCCCSLQHKGEMGVSQALKEILIDVFARSLLLVLFGEFCHCVATWTGPECDGDENQLSIPSFAVLLSTLELFFFFND